MGPALARLTLSNPSRPDLAPIRVDARLGSGSPHLRVPKRLAAALDLVAIDVRSLRSAEGWAGCAPHAGPLRMDMAGRVRLSGAVVCGDEVTLGSIASDAMDLVVDPSTGQVVTKPSRTSIAAGMRDASTDN